MQIQKMAPKDAVKHRRVIYLMLDQFIQPIRRKDGSYTTEIYLDDHRLLNKVKIVSGIKDTSFLQELETAEGFYNCIDAIGVLVTAKEEKEVLVCWKNYGKKDRYHGNEVSLTVAPNGVEHYIELNEYPNLKQDDVVGQIMFGFQKESIIAQVTVKLYLKEAYKEVVIPELEVEETIDFSSNKAKKLIERSLMNLGNLKRIQTMIEKAKQGEQITIACIGGSITQGAGAVPIHSKCYAYRFYEKLCEILSISKQQCKFIKAGIGGTSSELGLIRYDTQVEEMEVKPDLVVVEFAVNDAGDETQGVCHESLIYKILSKENNPAVIMLFSVFADDWNLQERLIPIGNAYNLPMISLKEALVDQFACTKQTGRVISKRQYFYDIFHPTNIGHECMAECLLHFIKKAIDSPKEERDLDLSSKEAIGRRFFKTIFFDRKLMEQNVKDNDLKEAKICIKEGDFTSLDLQLQSVERNEDVHQTPQFVNNWMYDGKKGTKSFCMNITCRGLFLVCKDSDSPSFGKTDIYVDGSKVRTYDARAIGWTHANAVLIIDENSAKDHFVEIKMAPDCKEKQFTILGMGVVLSSD